MVMDIWNISFFFAFIQITDSMNIKQIMSVDNLHGKHIPKQKDNEMEITTM